jgi:hypothetical protein
MRDVLFKYTNCPNFKNTVAMTLSRYTLFLFLTFYFSLLTFHLSAQGLTRYGQSASSSANFVDKNGKIGSIQALSKNGQVFAVPGVPTIGTATAGNAQASVPFTAPVSNGGSTITSYTATSSPSGVTGTLTQAGSGTITVTGLTNGTAYTFRVTATNAIGTSAASSASNSVTPATIPGAPTNVTATAGDTQATVTFTAPVSNGGSAITVYTVTSNPGNTTVTGSTSPITMTGLTSGTAYTFTVTATNVIGNSSASSASNSVTPLSIGTPYQGGIIFYILKSGDPGYDNVTYVQHGLIAAKVDQSTGIIWAVSAFYGTSVTGGTSTTLGSGAANTNNIISQNGTGYSTYAAGLCYNYTNADTGTGIYSDWYLPSADEIKLAILQNGVVKLRTNDAYWSSSEDQYNSAYYGDTGTYAYYPLGINNKYNTYSVRAIRSF